MSWANRILLFALLTWGSEQATYDRMLEPTRVLKLVSDSFNSLMPSHTPNSAMSQHEKTLTIDSSILQDQYPGFLETLSPGGNTSDDSGGPLRPLERTVPPHHEHRTLILCFDGTGM